ncbi:hypothetical protein R1sor_026891 [Riccia sorocarpa]|uniref:Tetratricopeptide repeat protein n=1 Tax=Riccia sorocarpa TaxID=122646 RepID=A0ABD3GDD6_9MARC
MARSGEVYQNCIFERFPAQEEQFLKLREEYRRTTLDLVREGQYGEALERLDHVLKWAPKDSECQELQRALPNRLQKLQSLAESTIFLGSNAATAGFTSRRDLEGAATSDHLPAENSVFSRIWKKLKFGVVIIPIMIVLLIVFPIVALLSCLIGDCLDEGISADCKNKYQSIEEWINGLIDDIES